VSAGKLNDQAMASELTASNHAATLNATATFYDFGVPAIVMS
jgi:hypothetical protein